MSSTLPKSIQAQANSGDNGWGTSSLDRAQALREFAQRMKNLPDDFLRLPASYNPPMPDAAQLQRAIIAHEAPLVDMIDISVVEAQLVKNYGLLRMDLYCKIRMGHMVCETPTCMNGAKNPKWDGVYQFTMKPGIDSFHLEIYDEKHLSPDEKVAWLCEPIPPEVFQGITVERWYPLSGRLGSNKEGSVLLVISHKRMPLRASNMARFALNPGIHGPQAAVFVPAANQGPVITGPNIVPVDPRFPSFALPQQTGNPAVGDLPAGESMPIPPASEDDVNQLSEMFPAIDKAVIKAILENNQNNKEASIGALLALG